MDILIPIFVYVIILIVVFFLISIDAEKFDMELDLFQFVIFPIPYLIWYLIKRNKAKKIINI